MFFGACSDVKNLNFRKIEITYLINRILDFYKIKCDSFDILTAVLSIKFIFLFFDKSCIRLYKAYKGLRIGLETINSL